MINKHMQKALQLARLSCDPNTKVGCVIVKDDEVLSQGCNSLPPGLNNDDYPLDCRDGAFLETKYPYMIHGEAKAIVSACCSLQDSELYVTLFPCNECAKLIIQAGIKTIYYLDDKYDGTVENIASKRMLRDAKVRYSKLNKD